MADISLRQLADFPEVKDKIIDAVELSSDDEFYGITLRFQDKTTLTFTIEPCVISFPVLAHWANGEEKRLKLYKPVRSNVQRV
ncbi:MAG: hypothetical protein DMG65_12220 [Candidatus Angelobacter sp. Gp1-AA117]|nr:MAG: hypothetical protein DMG65_12220 [Candidatus Angelobacter sp. Gp1-AA117]